MMKLGPIKRFIIFFLLIPPIIIQSADHFNAVNDSSGRMEFYVIKSYWHTGIILNTNDGLFSRLQISKDFFKFNYIDFGWGDEDFYQSESDFDLYLAAKAILVPTSSVIRVAGYYGCIQDIISWSDYCVKFLVDSTGYNNILAFIDSSFSRIGNEYQATSARANNSIIFYQSIHKYHLFNTCNTWVASAVKTAGFDIEPGDIITAKGLFDRISLIGKVLKPSKQKKQN